MGTAEIIELLKRESDFFERLPNLAEVVLYGSAMSEKEITDDIDLLLIPGRAMSESEKIDLRQRVWEHFKDHLPVALDVQTPRDDFTKSTLSSRGVPMTTLFSK